MSLDFGYLWFWTHGHLLVAAAALTLCGIARWRRWPRWILFIGGAVFLWSVAAFLVVQFTLGINRRMELPTQAFLNNLRAAGVAERATIQAADMRELPFGPDSFDGIVSTYAIDHLRREGRDRALREAARVLKPGKEFLLMIVAKDFWLSFAYGPLFMHGHRPNQARWAEALGLAGFEVVEQGTRPGTFYFLARKR